MPIDNFGENKLLSQTCKIPYSDCKKLGINPCENILKRQYYEYNNKKRSLAQVVVDERKINLLTMYEKNQKIVLAYNKVKTSPLKKCISERSIKSCILRRNCDEECILGECVVDCTNNKLQKSEWKPTFYRNSKISKTGLFATLNIKKDEFIMEYLGKEHLNDDTSKISGNNYIMQMKLHYIDAETSGNYARFINHSCQPNAKFSKIEVNGVQRCAIYAMGDINSGEEITCDYGYEKGKKDKNNVRCNCSKGCPNYFNFGKN